MTRERCYRPDEIGELIDLAPEHPRRRHLGECPRCRALLAEYRRFREPGSDFPAEDVADAEARLGEALRTRIDETKTVSEGAVRAPFRARRPRRRVVRLLPSAALIAAAVVLFVIVYRPFGGRRETRDSIVLRGVPEEPAAPAEDGITLRKPAFQGDGFVELRWDSEVGADAYRVHLYTSAIEELPALAAVNEPKLVFRPRDLAPNLGPGTVLLWRVAALRQGDEIALSPLGTFTVP
jgi:hypothetical protein